MTAEPATAVASPSVTSRVVTGAGWMMAWRMVSRALGFVSILILAGLLSPADFGIVAMATAISAAIDGMSSLGVREALVRLRDDERQYYDAAFTFQVARAVVTGVAIAGSAAFADDLFGDPRLATILPILGTLVVVGGFDNIGMVKFNRALDFRRQFVLQAGPRLLGFVVTTALAILLRSYWALIAGAAVAKVAGVAASYALSPHRPRFGLRGWRYLLHFSFWTWAGGLAAMALSKADPFLLSPVLGSAAFGLYMLAAEIALLPVSELLEPACAALFPGFAMARRHGSEPVAMGLTVAGALALCTIPFSAGISACSGYLVVSLLGPQWEAARPLIAVLAWTSMFLPFSWVTVTVLSAQGQIKRVFAGQALAAAIKIVALLSVRHTRDLTLIGTVATATIALESLMFVAQLHLAGNRELRGFAMTMARAAVALGATCGVLLMLPGTWQATTLDRWAATLAGAATGVLAFAVFSGVQAALWRLAGRPAGAEARLLSLALDDPRTQTLARRLRLRVVAPAAAP